MSLRALIVDDEPLARTALLRLLKPDRDISVIGQCGDGESAVQAIQQMRPDLVFLDVQMPEMDGYEAARQLRKRWTEIDRPRIIAMTGNAMHGDRERCLNVGMDDHVTKPVRIEDLRKSLERSARS